MKGQHENPLPRALSLILIVLCMLLGFVLGRCAAEPQPQHTAVITDADDACHSIENGDIRIRLCPDVVIRQNTMQNLYFSNLNTGCLMKLIITLDDTPVYESPLIESGKTIQADVIDTDLLQMGENKVLGQIYYYDPDRTLLGQSNVYMTLIVRPG